MRNFSFIDWIEDNRVSFVFLEDLVLRFTVYLCVLFLALCCVVSASQDVWPIDKKRKIIMGETLVGQEDPFSLPGLEDLPVEIGLKVAQRLDLAGLFALSATSWNFSAICDGEYKRLCGVEFGLVVPVKCIKGYANFTQPWKLTYCLFDNLTHYNDRMLGLSKTYSKSIFVHNPILQVYANLGLMYQVGLDCRIVHEKPYVLELMLALNKAIGSKAVVHFLQPRKTVGDIDMHHYVRDLVKDDGFNPLLIKEATSDDRDDLLALVDLFSNLPVLFFTDVVMLAEVLDLYKEAEHSIRLTQKFQSRLTSQLDILGNILF